MSVFSDLKEERTKAQRNAVIVFWQIFVAFTVTLLTQWLFIYFYFGVFLLMIASFGGLIWMMYLTFMMYLSLSKLKTIDGFLLNYMYHKKVKK